MRTISTLTLVIAEYDALAMDSWYPQTACTTVLFLSATLAEKGNRASSICNKIIYLTSLSGCSSTFDCLISSIGMEGNVPHGHMTSRNPNMMKTAEAIVLGATPTSSESHQSKKCEEVQYIIPTFHSYELSGFAFSDTKVTQS